MESKLVGDLGYDYNYCHGKNYLAKECMLRRLNEKKEGEDDEAYFMRKLEEIRRKKTNEKSMPSLIMQEDVIENEFGGVEIQSTDSKMKRFASPHMVGNLLRRKKDLRLMADV